MLLAATLISERYHPGWLRCVAPRSLVATGAIGDGVLWPLRLWDYVAYKEIADMGYPHAASGVSYAYFPLWPIVLAVGIKLGSAAATSTILALGASAFAFAGIAVLAPWVAQWRVAIALAALPGSYSLLLAYPDGVALAAAAWSCVYATRRHWAVAAALAVVCAVARPNGVLVAIPLLFLASHEKSVTASIAAISPIIAALGVWAYFGLRSGNAFAFTRAEAHWHRGRPWDLPASAFGHWNWVHYYQGFIAILAIALCVLLWRRAGNLMWSVFATAVLVVSLGSGSVASIPRHMLFAFPLTWVLADMLPASRVLAVAASGGLLLNVAWIFLLRCEFP